DEGTGFDAVTTFQRFQGQETYFEGHGCGFRNLHRAAATVSYENDGRTLLLCFQPALRSSDFLENSPSKLLDSERITAARSAELPEFVGGQVKLESCRVYTSRWPA